MITLYWNTIRKIFVIQIKEKYIWQLFNTILITRIQFYFHYESKIPILILMVK